MSLSWQSWLGVRSVYCSGATAQAREVSGGRSRSSRSVRRPCLLIGDTWGGIVSYISPSARRRAAFVKAAGEIYDHLEKWYIQNPNASPHEIALETLRRRQQLMRKAVALLGSGQSPL